jgi:integrase
MGQKRIDFITFEEFKKLYKVEKNKKMKLCILLGFGSGLRISEIIGYKRRFKRKTNKQTKVIEYFKDDSEIPPLTKDMIRFKEHQIRLNDAKGNKWRTTIIPPAFEETMINLLPIKIPRRTIQYRFEQLSKKVLNKRMSFHTLRHGFGNYQANVLKLPLPIVQQMMGHSRLDTTGIYTKANPEQAISESWKAMTGEG